MIGASSFGAAIAYVTRSHDGEEPLAVWSEGVSSFETAAFEMDCVAGQARTGDPLYHLIISFAPGEQPSFERARAALAHVRSRLGFDGLQSVASLQNDGKSGMWHIHDITNLVDPQTGVARSTWHDAEIYREACREVERADGWRELPRGREASRVARDRYGTRKKWQEFLRREVAPEFRDVVEDARSTWSSVKDWLKERRIEYAGVGKYGARLVGEMSGWTARVSQLGFTHRELVERFGAWRGRVAEERVARERSIEARLGAVRADLEKLPDNAPWNDIHAAFESRALDYRRSLNGARVVETEGPGSLRIGREDALSLRNLQARFGAFESSRAAEYRAHAKDAVDLLEDLLRGERLRQDPSAFMESLFHTQAIVTDREIDAALMRDVGDAEMRGRVREAIDERLVVLERSDGTIAYTTAEIAAEEAQADAAVRKLAAKPFERQITRPPGAHLDAQQRPAYEYALDGRESLKLVEGVGGAGKTVLINDVVAGLESAGYRVRGIAVSNSAVDVMRRETSLRARSVAAELAAWGRPDEPPLTSRDVLVIDELSTLGTPQGAKLAAEAARVGAPILGFGDGKQFESVARGSMLRVMRDALGDRTVDMERTRRQKIEWQARVTEKMRGGKIREGLREYRQHGLLHEHKSDEDARKALVMEWARLERSGVATSVETYTNAERRELNYLLRSAHRALGRLDGSDVTLATMDGATPYAIGDRVVLRETIVRDELFNGSVATVRGVDGSQLTVERDGKTYTFDTREHPGVQHGYCSTEFREQGNTREAELQYFTKHVNARSVTVGMSRHTDEYHGFYSKESFRRGFDGLADLAERNRSKELVRDGREIGRGREAVERARSGARSTGREVEVGIGRG